ncbi:MAG: endolytic transglycosylase MltG [Alphaproteobacteria bacterium]
MPSRRVVRWIAGLALVAALAVAAGAGWAHHRFERPGPTETAKTVVVPKGSGLAGIAALLERQGLVATPMDRYVFMAGVVLVSRPARLRAGEYEFPAHVSLRGAMEILASGVSIVRRFTAPEGLTSTEIVALLNGAEGLDGEITAAPPEGSLLPETYHYTWGDSRTELLARMRSAQTEAVARLWPDRGPGAPETQAAALVLASIVEKETGVGGERARIAAVFLNRLRLGMKLQSDPTVIYGLSPGSGELDHALTRSDLTRPTPYNTYVIDGLPPGPICNPGRAAIAAVLKPADSTDLYFVADGSGGHAFAETLAEHNRNVAKWRRIERSR